MRKDWTAYHDKWPTKAIADDRALLDADLMGREIRAQRYRHKKKGPMMQGLSRSTYRVANGERTGAKRRGGDEADTPPQSRRSSQTRV